MEEGADLGPGPEEADEEEEEEEPGACELCGLPAARRCAACRLVAYCGRQHQKQDWPRHKGLCRPFEVRSSAALGRHLLATRDLQPGALLLSEAPLAAGPRLRDPAPLCPGCLRAPDPSRLARCRRCLLPLCGPACPGLRGHQPECAVLRLEPALLSPQYALLLPLRCLLLQRRRPDRWRQLLALESHTDERGPASEAYREIQAAVVAPLSRLLAQLPADALPERSDAMLHRVCAVLDVNAMEVRGPGGADAAALFPTASLMEHSCLPNTRHGFHAQPGGGRRLRISLRTALRIPKGAHITTMYTHALWGTHARRAHLRDTKYFSCECRRCADPSELGTCLSGLRCLGLDSDGACGGTQLPAEPLRADTEWRCDRCPVTLPSAHVEELVERIGDEVDSVLAGSPSAAQLQQLDGKLTRLLHPHHFHVFAVRHSLLQLLGRPPGPPLAALPTDSLRWKADACRDLLGVCGALDPGAARLSLYSAVLRVELQAALRELAAREQRQQQAGSGGSGGSGGSAAAAEAAELLRAAESALAPEPPGSPGERYAAVVRAELRGLEAQLEAQLQAQLQAQPAVSSAPGPALPSRP